MLESSLLELFEKFESPLGALLVSFLARKNLLPKVPPEFTIAPNSEGVAAIWNTNFTNVFFVLETRF